jgi:hypothetical protein
MFTYSPAGGFWGSYRHRNAYFRSRNLRPTPRVREHNMEESGMAGRKVSKLPQPGSDGWKAFVADAIAKPPSRRTKAEREAIAAAMAQAEAERASKH